MGTLLLTRGLPGSGKSTWAQQQVDADANTVRVNRDDLRFELFRRYSNLSKAREKEITEVQQSRARAALIQGKNVIIDDTNLNTRSVGAWRSLAEDFDGKVQFSIKDFNTSVQECIRRDESRRAAGNRGTGSAVIEDMSNRYLRRGRLPYLPPALLREIPVPPAPESRPHGVIFDIDGTLCDVRTVRHHMRGEGKRDFHAFHTESLHCPPNPHVAEMARECREKGLAVIIVTAREQRYQELTENWLDKNGIEYDHIFTRPLGDLRPDYETKKDILGRVEKFVEVLACVDDNPQVIRLWKENNFNTVIVDGFDDENISPNLEDYSIIEIDSPFRAGRCLRCNRKMTKPGYLGPECARKYAAGR